VQGLVDELASHAAGLIDAPMDEFDALDRS
jgi:hypothetical protein